MSTWNFDDGRCDSCDTFVALGDVTADGSVIFGKNSDRPFGEVQEVVAVPRSYHELGDMLQCTYISIPQVAVTWGVVLSKPAWIWGAEMGANEHGVAIGNEAVWNIMSNVEYDSIPRLLGMDLLRLGLERSRTAKEALTVICNLLEEFGQGGPCSDIDLHHLYHNSFLIADPTEAWILETARTLWVGKNIKVGVRNISNCMSIETDFDLSSNGLKELCAAKGWWNPEEVFNWKKVMGEPLGDFPFRMKNPEARLNSGRELLLERAKEPGKFNAQSMMQVLRNKESAICRPYFHRKDKSLNPTTGSQVSVLSSSHLRTTHWFTATPDPSTSVYKPFFFGDDGTGEASELTSSPVPFPRKDVKDPFERSHSLWTHYKNLAETSPEVCQMKMNKLQDKLIDRCEETLALRMKNNDQTLGKYLFHEAVQQEMAL